MGDVPGWVEVATAIGAAIARESHRALGSFRGRDTASKKHCPGGAV